MSDGADSAEPVPVPNEGVIGVFGALLARIDSSSENIGSSNSLGSISSSKHRRNGNQRESVR